MKPVEYITNITVPEINIIVPLPYALPRKKNRFLHKYQISKWPLLA
jgi:hypothetical protein